MAYGFWPERSPGQIPPGGVPLEINRDHPLAQNLLGLWVFGRGPPVNLVTGEVSTPFNNPNDGVGPAGPSYRSNGTRQGWLLRSGPTVAGLSTWTIASIVHIPAGAATSSNGRPIYAERHPTTGNDILKLQLTEGRSGIGLVWRNTAGNLYILNWDPDNRGGDQLVATASLAPGGSQAASGGRVLQAYANGIATAGTDIGTTSTVQSQISHTSAGYDVRDGNAFWNGDIALIAVSDRAWTADQHLLFARDPWDIVRPAYDTPMSLLAEDIPLTTLITASGAGTFTVPANVYSLEKVEVWGAGAGGSRIANPSGGGGGAYSSISDIAVTPGQEIPYSVGAGGALRTTNGSGNPGGDTWFSSSGTLLAKGGSGGGSLTVGAGGQASSGVGTVKWSGGDGALASNTGTIAIDRTGGGGAATPTSNGSPSAERVGGNAGSGSSAGGGGAFGAAGTSHPDGGGGGGAGYTGTSAGAGGFPGGGGGGYNGGQQSGAGAGGQIRITYRISSAPAAQELTGAKISDADTLRTPTVAAGAVTLTSAKISDADTLRTPTVAAGAVALTSAKISDADTLYVPATTVGAVALTPTKLVDADTLPAPTVASGGTVVALGTISDADTLRAPTATVGPATLTPTKLADADTLRAPSTSVTLALTKLVDADTLRPPTRTSATTHAAPKITDSDALRGPSVAAGIASIVFAKISDADTIRVPVVNPTLLPTKLTDADTLRSPTAAPGAASVAPQKLTDGDVLFPPGVGEEPPQSIQAGGLVDPDTLRTPSISTGAVSLTPSKHVDDDGVVREHDVEGVIAVSLVKLVDSDALRLPAISRTVRPSKLASTSLLRTPAISRGAVTLSHVHLADADTLRAPESTQGPPTAHLLKISDADALFPPLLVRGLPPGQDVAPPRLTDPDTLHGPGLVRGPAPQTCALPHLVDDDGLWVPVVSPFRWRYLQATLSAVQTFGCSVGPMRVMSATETAVRVLTAGENDGSL